MTEPDYAFARLADDHLDAVYRLARGVVRDPSEAPDATHDALPQAWRKWSTLRDTSHFEPWFDRVLVNICCNRPQHASRSEARDISTEMAMAARTSRPPCHQLVSDADGNALGGGDELDGTAME